MKNRFEGISWSTSWTQDYNNMNPFWQKSQLTTNEELERLDEIDDRIALMDNYPDAQQLLKNIFKC